MDLGEGPERRETIIWLRQHGPHSRIVESVGPKRGSNPDLATAIVICYSFAQLTKYFRSFCQVLGTVLGFGTGTMNDIVSLPSWSLHSRGGWTSHFTSLELSFPSCEFFLGDWHGLLLPILVPGRATTNQLQHSKQPQATTRTEAWVFS